jgi:NADH-quinone oxidoreductase subunit N
METALQQPAAFVTLTDLVQLGPVLVLVLAILLLILLDVILRAATRNRSYVGLGSAVGISIGAAVAAFCWTLYLWTRTDATGNFVAQQIFTAVGPSNPSVAADKSMLEQGYQPVWWSAGALTIDQFALFVCLAVCVTVALVCLLLVPHLMRTRGYRMEILPLLLTSACGMMLLGMSHDLLITFISIEILSLPLYVLCGMDERRQLSRESALKYFLLGAFASGFLVYGIALVYGMAGHLNYTAITHYLACCQDYSTTLLVGLGLVGVGLAFKLALVPFHAWVPDVYQGAPTPVTAFMAVGVKLAVFAAAARFVLECLPYIPEGYWKDGIALFAALSMLAGNLFALHQMSAKRLLAYSAIAHSGYLALALCTANASATKGMLVYLTAYGLASLGAFALIGYLAPADQDDVYLDEVHELSRRAPMTALTLAILLLSLAGFPLTAGFIGKLVVFTDAWRAGLYGLVIFAVLNCVVGAYYYLRFILAMYMQPRAPGAVELELKRMSAAHVIPGLVTAILTLLLGVLPAILFEWVANCQIGLK